MEINSITEMVVVLVVMRGVNEFVLYIEKKNFVPKILLHLNKNLNKQSKKMKHYNDLY